VPPHDGSVPADADADAVLRCRACGRTAASDGPQWCAWCFGPVEVVLDAARVRAGASAAGAGPPSIARYAGVLPPGLDLAAARSGWVPMRPAPGLGAALDLDDLWVLDETANPSGSFKDRVVDVALARAVPRRARVVAASSTGNLARAVAVGATRRGLRSVLLVPEALPEAEVLELVRAGALVVAVRGGYDAAARLATEREMDRPGWAWVNGGLRPWYELGAVTAGLEIAERLGWTLPGRVVAPVASGAYLLAVHRAHRALVAARVSAGPPPRLTVAQPAGCAPIAAALVTGTDDVRPVRPATRATAVAMGDPPDGPDLVRATRATGGAGVIVPEDEIESSAALVAALHGAAVDLAVGVAVAGLRRLRAAGRVDRDERIVLALTGAAAASPPATADPAGVAGGRALGTIEPSLEALDAVLPPELLDR